MMEISRNIMLFTLIMMALIIMGGISAFISKNPYLRDIEIEQPITEINEPIEENVTIPTNETCKPDQLFFRGKCFDFVTDMTKEDVNEQFW